MRREVVWRLVPVGLLGVIAIAYVLARPALAARNPYLTIWEFPIGAILVTVLLWLALRRGKPEAPPEPWHRHEQVVRPLADPALAPLVGTLERWVETGDDPQSAAEILARARTNDPAERATLVRELSDQLASKTTRRSRGSQLKKYMES